MRRQRAAPATPSCHATDTTSDDIVQVTRIDQIAIAVTDIDEALAFYANAFGLQPTSRRMLHDHGVEEAMIDIGGVWLQLVKPLGPDSPVTRFLERHGPGLHHLGFGVASLDAALDHLRATPMLHSSTTRRDRAVTAHQSHSCILAPPTGC
jgi:methylmalonyl-CoA epimerase